MTFFHDFGAFNRAGKTVTKIGIYSKPPPKSEIYRDFNNSRPNLVPYTIYLITTQLHLYGSLNLSVLGIGYSEEKPNSFSVILVACLAWCSGVVSMLSV
jgi:hypothetical protein